MTLATWNQTFRSMRDRDPDIRNRYKTNAVTKDRKKDECRIEPSKCVRLILSRISCTLFELVRTIECPQCR